jgi:hypothetical protein
MKIVLLITSFLCVVVQHEISLNSAVMSMMSHHTNGASERERMAFHVNWRMKMLAADECFVSQLVPLAQIHFCSLLASADLMGSGSERASERKEEEDAKRATALFISAMGKSQHKRSHIFPRCVCVCVYHVFCNHFHCWCWLTRLVMLLLTMLCMELRVHVESVCDDSVCCCRCRC